MQVRRMAPMCSATAIVALASVANASVIEPMEVPELYRDASIVVHGEVIDQTSRWENIDGNELIFTYSTVRVNSSAKQPAESRLMVVRSVGGGVGAIHQTLVGEASLDVGEEVVLFVENAEGWPSPSVVGFHNGKFSVQRDAQGTITGLVRDRGQSPGAIPQARDTVTLSTFLGTLERVEAGEIDEHGHETHVHTLTPVGRPLDSRTLEARPQRRAPVAPASLSLSYAAPSCPDINADGSVDVSDLSDMVSAWGGSSPAADLDGSGTVDINDLSSLTAGWGSCR